MFKRFLFTLTILALVALIGFTSFLMVGALDSPLANEERAAAHAGATNMKNKRNVAILVHEGVELLDFAGPGEVFASANHRSAFQVYTVAASPAEVVSQGFVTVKPQYTFANCPPPDVVILPGGRTDIPLSDPAVINWIKQSSEKAEVVMSVCTGAFLLAKAGLLDGREATTHWSAISSLRQQAPQTTVHENRRFVDNGKVITAAGVSAGIDASLHVVDKLLGREAAAQTAHYMEYKWQPEQ
ncbi:MAG TPA: DJ-1/PfpI family protein [Blastocatellia bacterium]|nr:DJ-1/PfpI family protein [Blastocatellia bacterium]